MTYKELLEELKKLNSEQLNQRVAVHLINADDFVPVQYVGTAAGLGIFYTDRIVLGSDTR
jgi:hypothetical protein